MTNEDLDKLLELKKQATDQDIINPEWGYYEANKDDLGPGQFAYVLYRDGFYQTKARHYHYAAEAMNALPKLIAEVKALREVEKAARAIVNSKDDIGIIEHRLALELISSLQELDEARRG
jgi:hypothetical protein